MEHWDFYLAYNLFRIAAILQGIMARAQDGTAASEDAIRTGRCARPLAELGLLQHPVDLRIANVAAHRCGTVLKASRQNAAWHSSTGCWPAWIRRRPAASSRTI